MTKQDLDYSQRCEKICNALGFRFNGFSTESGFTATDNDTDRAIRIPHFLMVKIEKLINDQSAPKNS